MTSSAAPAAPARPKGGAVVTAIVCSLAFMAVANAAIVALRILLTRHSLRSDLVFASIVGGLLLFWWAIARVRKQRDHELMSDGPVDFDVNLQAGRTWPSWVRWVRWAAAVAFLGLGAVMIAPEWATISSGVARLSDIQWHSLRWALYAEVLAVIAFAELTRQLLRAGGVRVRFRAMFGLTLASNAMALTLPGGPAWATAFSFNQLRRRGVHSSLSAYALAVTWLLSAFALLAIALVGIDLAGPVGPAAAFRVIATSAAALVAAITVGCVLALRLPRSRAWLLLRVEREARRPHLRRIAERVRPWVEDAGRVRLSPLTLARCLAAAVLNWILDCGCLVFSILAVGGHVPWQGVLAAYGLTQLAAVLPITPGGLGLVEGTLSLLLIAYHLPAATAVAAVIVYRIISFWLLVPTGWAMAGALVAVQRRRRLAAASALRADGVTRVPATTA